MSNNSVFIANFGAKTQLLTNIIIKFKVKMKKLLFSLVMLALATNVMVAQDVNKAPKAPQAKECCKDHKDGQKCDKPADQQCPDCKAKAAAEQKDCEKKCEKAAGKHECEKAEGKKCEKAAGKKCEKAEGKKCEKAAGMKHECKKEAKKDCQKAEGMKCEKAEKKDCAKHECEKAEGKKCEKPADQQCPDCKDKAKKN